ncbi:MAG: hypothetical protein K2X35_23470 [Bryobacteraceae bacterium]|nr:hypothetical protein [Bryobacteraceae bacterium]
MPLLNIDASRRLVETANRVVSIANRNAERQQAELNLILHRAHANPVGRVAVQEASRKGLTLVPGESLVRAGEFHHVDGGTVCFDMAWFGERGFRGDRVLAGLLARAVAGPFAGELVTAMYAAAAGEPPESPAAHYVRRHQAELRRMHSQHPRMFTELARGKWAFNPPRDIEQSQARVR